MKHWLGLSCLLSLCLFLWAGAAESADGTVTLYAVNHIQSQLVPIKRQAKSRGVVNGGLAYAAGRVLQDSRSQENPLFFTTGEVVSGNLWRCFGGRPEMECMKEAGVQVTTLGKHEFDFGVNHLKTALSWTNIPVVVSNLEAEDPELKARLKKTHLIKAGNMTVGFFGLLSSRVMSLTAAPEGVTLNPDLESVAREMVGLLKEQGADLIVLLSGMTSDENVALARAVAGIHVISGAGVIDLRQKGMNLVPDPEGNKTAVIWCGDRAQFVGRLRAVVRGGKLDPELTAWDLLPVDSTATPVKRVLAIALDYENRLGESLNRVIGTVENPIDARNSVLRSGEAALGNFVCDSFRWKLGTDVAIQNGGGIRGNRIYPVREVKE